VLSVNGKARLGINQKEVGGEMTERRRYQRHLVQLPVEYWETEDAVLAGVVFNVSETGLLICSAEDMPSARN
jgi:hypothetical protein